MFSLLINSSGLPHFRSTFTIFQLLRPPNHLNIEDAVLCRAISGNSYFEKLSRSSSSLLKDLVVLDSKSPSDDNREYCSVPQSMAFLFVKYSLFCIAFQLTALWVTFHYLSFSCSLFSSWYYGAEIKTTTCWRNVSGYIGWSEMNWISISCLHVNRDIGLKWIYVKKLGLHLWNTKTQAVSNNTNRCFRNY